MKEIDKKIILMLINVIGITIVIFLLLQYFPKQILYILFTLIVMIAISYLMYRVVIRYASMENKKRNFVMSNKSSHQIPNELPIYLYAIRYHMIYFDQTFITIVLDLIVRNVIKLAVKKEKEEETILEKENYTYYISLNKELVLSEQLSDIEMMAINLLFNHTGTLEKENFKYQRINFLATLKKIYQLPKEMKKFYEMCYKVKLEDQKKNSTNRQFSFNSKLNIRAIGGIFIVTLVSFSMLSQFSMTQELRFLAWFLMLLYITLYAITLFLSLNIFRILLKKEYLESLDNINQFVTFFLNENIDKKKELLQQNDINAYLVVGYLGFISKKVVEDISKIIEPEELEKKYPLYFLVQEEDTIYEIIQKSKTKSVKREALNKRMKK